MSEYIITDEGMGFDLEDALAQGGFIKQRIVRCRDCKFNDGDVDALVCTHPKDLRPHFGTLAVEPDGLCAWGERA